MAYNKTILVGRLTRDPELRRTGNGIPVASFSLAVDRQGSEETDFFDIVAWRKTAEFVDRYFTKGKEALVEGKLQNRSYKDKDGNTRKVTEIIADEVRFVGRRDDTPSNGDGDGFQPEDDDDLNLPF